MDETLYVDLNVIFCARKKRGSVADDFILVRVVVVYRVIE